MSRNAATERARIGARGVAVMLLGIVGGALTYYTLARHAEATHDLFGTGSGALDDADVGSWCALGGFLLAGVSAASGPTQTEES